jgi:hypothetical protein
MVDAVDQAAMCRLLRGIVLNWVREARLDVYAYSNPLTRLQADYVRRKALYDFERAKQDPEGWPLLQALSAATGRREVDILDALLTKAGLPWEVQPDVLGWYDALRLWDACDTEAA